MRNCGLSGLPASMTRLTNLRMLNIDGNRFPELPWKLLHASTIRRLDASGIGLLRLPPDFWSKGRLEYIVLRNNRLAELPAVHAPRAIRILDIQNNPIRSLPPGFEKLSITFFDIGGTPLARSLKARGVTRLPNVKTLTLKPSG